MPDLRPHGAPHVFLLQRAEPWGQGQRCAGQNCSPNVQSLQQPRDDPPTRGLGVLQRTQPASGQSPQCPDAYLQNGLALVLAGAVEERERGSQGAITPLPSLWAQPGTQPCWLSSHPGGGGRPDPSAPCSPWRLGWQQGRHVAELAAELQPSIPAQLPALPLIDFAVRSRQAAARCPAPHLLTLSPPGRGDGKWGGGQSFAGGLRSPTAW